jgi:hypothetical protein
MGVATATNSNAVGVTDNEFRTAVDVLKTSAASFTDVAAISTNLNAIGANGTTVVTGGAVLDATQVKAEAIAKDLQAIIAGVAGVAVAGTITANDKDNLEHAYDTAWGASKQAADAGTLATNLDTGMTAGPGVWNNPVSGSTTLVDGDPGGGAAATDIPTGNLGLAGISEEIQRQYDIFLQYLTDGNTGAPGAPTLQPISDSALIAAVQAVFAAAPADRAAAINEIKTRLNFDAKLTGAKNIVYNALRGLFDVAPIAAAGANPRTFTYQISQNNLTNDLNLSNASSTNFAVIDPANMDPNDTVLFIFDSTGNTVRDVNAGKIIYKNLTNDSNLHLTHTMLDGNNMTFGTITFEEIKDPLNKKATEEHLTLQLSTVGKGHSDVNSDFKFQKAIFLKKLILGIDNTQGLKLVLIDKSKNAQVIGSYKPSDGGGVKVKCEDNLTVKEDIEVLQNSSLIFNNGNTLRLGRNIKLRDGDATLTLGTGEGSRETLNIEPFLPQAGNIEFKDGDILHLTSNVTLLAAAPDAAHATNYFFTSLTGAQNATFSITAADPAIKLTLDRINPGATHVNGMDITTNPSPALITVADGSTLKLENVTVATEDHEKSPIIAQFGNNGALELSGGVVLGKAGVNITALKAGQNFTIDLAGNTTLLGNINAGKDAKLAVDLSNPSTLTWLEGNLTLPANEKLKIEIGDSIDPILANGLPALSGLAGTLNILDVSGNAALLGNIANLISINLTASPLLKGATLTQSGGILQLNIPANAVPNNFTEYLANSGGNFDRTYISDGLFSIVDKAIQNGAKTNIEAQLLRGILSSNVSNAQKSKILSSLSKTTTEEKNRATLALIDSARETIYGKMGQDPAADKHYSVWGSGFGDVTRNGSSDSYKMKCNSYGFTLGVDTHSNDNFLIGATVGYGKAKAKFKGDMMLTDNNCDIKSYFGGIYGMWDEFVTDLSLKFSCLAGHGKYEEKQGFVLGNIVTNVTFNSDHDGHWLSGNVDCTYKHWNVYGFNVGPWISLSATTIHQKSGDIGSATTTATNHIIDGNTTHCKREVAAADRRAIEATLGIAADYEFAAGNFGLALGYKHDWRKLKGGKVSIWEAFSEGNYKGLTAASNSNHISEYFKFDASNVKTGKHAFVVQADWNMQFGDFGLTLGGNGQAGSRFKDISGFITASYSF